MSDIRRDLLAAYQRTIGEPAGSGSRASVGSEPSQSPSNLSALAKLLRRAAPGDAPADIMAGSVMSPNYVPETSSKQLGLGALRGVLDMTPVGVADAVQSGINNMKSPVGAALRAVVGKGAPPGDAALGKLGLLGSGPGYDAGRYAANAAAPMMGLLGNQAGGALPKGYARDQSGAIVWHGSPHKFDKFDASKIGTGEGAQAYGHGLYLAESPDVANSYKNGLTNRNQNLWQEIENVLPDTLKGKAPDWSDEIVRGKTFSDLLAQVKQPWQKALLRQKKAPLEDLIKKQQEGGSLYKVDLPDDAIARMLDWDKPLSQQPHTLEPFAASHKASLESMPTVGDPYSIPIELAREMVGGKPAALAYQKLAGQMGSAKASEMLRQAGIPGIRYLDGGSRGTGSGTSNFVVFPGNEGLLNILERNGQPLR